MEDKVTNGGTYTENIKISVIGENNGKLDQPTNGIYTLEEAMREAKSGKCQIILIILTGIGLMGSIIENVNVSYILPFAKCDLKLTTGEQGIVTSISFLGIVCTSHFWGFLADTWGRQKVIRLSTIGGYIFSFLSAFAANTTILILLRFVAGAFLAGAQAGTFSYISEFHSSETASRAAATISIFISAIWLYMSAMAIFLIPMDWSFWIFSIVEFKPWRLFLLCNSTINLWNAIVFSFLPETPKFLLAMNRKEEALKVLSRVYAMNTGEPKENYPVKEIVQQSLGSSLNNKTTCFGVIRLLWTQTKPIFSPPLLISTWKLSYVIFAMYSIGHGTFMWFPNFLVQLQTYDGPAKTLCEVVSKQDDHLGGECVIDNKNTKSFQLLFGIGVFFLIISVLSTFCMKMIKPKVLVCGWLLLSMITCLLLNFVNEFYWIVACFVAFLSCCVCANVVMAVAVNLFPTNYRAMATSFILMCGRIGGVIGSNIVGVLLENFCPWIFYLFAGIIITCLAVFASLKTSTKSSTIQTSAR